MRITYDRHLKKLAKELRNNSTKSEVYLWNHLKGKRMRGYDFHRQKPIGKFIVDFYCNKLLLVIELDGYSHDFDEVYAKDMAKEKVLKDMGLVLLRFADDEVMNDIDNVLRSIEGFIEDYEKKHTPSPS